MMRRAVYGLFAVACSSSPVGSSGTPAPTYSCPAGDQNPYGVCYPTTQMEKRIANLSFIGLDPSSMAITKLRLAQLYDPQQKLLDGVGLKLLHLTVDGMWDAEPPQSASLVAKYPDVVFLELLDDGPVVGVGATLDDLKTWMGKYDVQTPAFIDPNNANLGIFFDAAAVPFSMNVDLRSMQVLDAKVGFVSTQDLDQDVQSWLAWIQANPALQ